MSQDNRLYTEEDVLEAIKKAFWDGIEQGGNDYAGEYFSAEDYLPDTKQETGER